MLPYFERTALDRRFYAEQIAPRLPRRIFDIHVHLNLPEHVAAVSAERVATDWALQCGYTLPVEEAYACARELFPDAQYRIAGFPWPIREADLEAANRYLAGFRARGRLAPFMCVRPEWDPDECERVLLEGGFAGFKPYPDMASGRKGADIPIPEFLPPAQWEVLERHRKAVVLHLPRAERMASPENLRELRDLRQRYPAVTIIIAHFGRAFCPYYLPILFWHGRRTWSEREYRTLCREPFAWNTRREPPEVEAGYTLFLYEQMKAILDAMDRHGFTDGQREAVFHGNAQRIIGWLPEWLPEPPQAETGD